MDSPSRISRLELTASRLSVAPVLLELILTKVDEHAQNLKEINNKELNDELLKNAQASYIRIRHLYLETVYTLQLAQSLLMSASRLLSLTTDNGPIPPPGENAFVFFPRLPAELRTMIWMAAAQPPSCAHYFAKFDVAKGGCEPATNFMDDRGLWTACRESHQVVEAVYQKRHAHFANAACNVDNYRIELRSCQLAEFNETGAAFKLQIRKFPLSLRMGLQELEKWLSSAMSGEHSSSTQLVRELYAKEAGWKIGDDEFHIKEVESLCTMLEDEYLS